METEKFDSRRIARSLAAMILLSFAAIAVTGMPVLAQPKTAGPPYLSAFPNFAPRVTPMMPGDVDIALKTSLEKAKQFALVQREFDLDAWQMLVALNWPTNDRGQPAPSFEDTAFGAPHWTLWHNSSTIFRADGGVPAACTQPAAARQLVLTRNPELPVSVGLTPFHLEANVAANPRTTRFLGVISAVGELNVSNLSDIQQAFTGPMIDQNGNFVFYEILIDPNEVTYLCDNKLYNINGQVAFTGSNGKVVMPTGHPQQDWSGSFELKLAWKVLIPGKDEQSRFFTEDAYIMDQGSTGGAVQRKVQVGLVGMHIAHKSETSPQWIWATFEQVDNLAVDPVAHPKLHASFNDANCSICTTDVQPQKVNGVYPKVPTQVSRTIPIPDDAKSLNTEVAVAFAKSNSVWQYYELIDTQWPTDPVAPPSAWDSGLPQAVTNKSGGQPTPTFLTNITMETYFQGGNQPACQQEEGVPSSANCPPSYASLAPGTAIAAYTPNPVVWTSTLNSSAAPIKPGISTQINATESCIGCHSSAGVWTSFNPNKQSGQLTADFSWLLSQKAQYAK